jgi:Tfp pilus assembly protein PilN
MDSIAKPCFLCRSCELCMCDDCRSIAHEYEELEQRRKATLFQLEERLEAVTTERDRLARHLELLESIVPWSVTDTLQAWANTLTLARLTESIKHALDDERKLDEIDRLFLSGKYKAANTKLKRFLGDSKP